MQEEPTQTQSLARPSNFISFKQLSDISKRTWWEEKDITLNVVHSSLGLVTEYAEIINYFERSPAKFTEEEKVNILEEVGDLFYYYSVLINSVTDKFINKPDDDSEDLLDIVLYTYKGKQYHINEFREMFTCADLAKKMLAYKATLETKLKDGSTIEDTLLARAIISMDGLKQICYLMNIDYFEGIQKMKVKLEKRYPEKFSTDLALNRDTDSEFQVMSKN